MKIEINGPEIRICAKNSKRSLRIYCRESDGAEIISFEISDGAICRGGHLPDVEFTKRDTLLRHLGSNIEKVQ